MVGLGLQLLEDITSKRTNDRLLNMWGCFGGWLVGHFICPLINCDNYRHRFQLKSPVLFGLSIQTQESQGEFVSEGYLVADYSLYPRRKHVPLRFCSVIC